MLPAQKFNLKIKLKAFMQAQVVAKLTGFVHIWSRKTYLKHGNFKERYF